jgi:hypothetical protein
VTQNANGIAGTLIQIQIKVGDPNQILYPDDFLGVSFNLNWDNTQYLEYSGSATAGAFLGNDPISLVQGFLDHIEVGLTRTSGGVTGSGVVLNCSLRVKTDAPSGTIINLSLSNITATKSDGSSLALDVAGNSVITLNSGLTVWPGDANNNGYVNASDVLYLGLYYNKTGSVRPNHSIIWVGQSCPPWIPDAATYADCNGDGTVNATDILAIGLNYSKTHTTSYTKISNINSIATANIANDNNTSESESIRKVNSTGSISLVDITGISVDGANTPNTQVKIDVKVGDPTSVTALLGVSFNLTWLDTTLIEGISTLGGSFLGSNPLVIGQNFTDHIEVGISSTNGGHDGSGIIAECILKTKKVIPLGTRIEFILSNIIAIDANGGWIDLTQANDPFYIVTEVKNVVIPFSYSLSQNYPNPFNPSTRIQFGLPEESNSTLKVYDILGSEVITLLDNENLSAGSYSYNLIADGLPSGIYIYVLTTKSNSSQKSFRDVKKMILLK